MKILVPSDFSENANHALSFAKNIALATNSKITVLFTFQTEYGFAVQAAEMERQIIHDANKQLNKTILDLNEDGIDADHKILEKSVSNAIVSTAHDFQYDLIIMGTQGASGIQKALFGSNTATVINSSKVPVLAIPPQAQVDSLQSMVLAVDLLEETQEILDQTLFLLGHLKLPIEILQVQAPETKNDAQEINSLSNKLQKQFPSNSIQIYQVNDENVLNGIDSFLKSHSHSLLVMISRQKSFWESLTEKSHSVEMAYHTHVPLLVIKENK